MRYIIEYILPTVHPYLADPDARGRYPQFTNKYYVRPRNLTNLQDNLLRQSSEPEKVEYGDLRGMSRVFG